jgi:hypothetical protein
MAKHVLLLLIGIALSSILPTRFADANDLMVGCWSRPACGKVCQLVCETKKLTVFCYGSQCKEICIPGPSRAGCKHCETCCSEDEGGANCGPGSHACQAQSPECKFCWRDWFACGCATPRTVKVLTKYQAEKEVDWYHWKVVDAGSCGCPTCCRTVDRTGGSKTRNDALDANSTDGRLCVYKPAPLEAKLGDALELSDEERLQLEQMTMQLDTVPQSPVATAPVSASDSEQSPREVPAAAASQPSGESAWHSVARYFRLGG